MAMMVSEGPSATDQDGRWISERVWELRQLHVPYMPDRVRIRAIMNGGKRGIMALLGPKMAKNEELVPAANLIHTGSKRLAQKIGRSPLLKVPAPDDSDSETQRKKAQDRESYIRTYDEWSRVPMHLPQVGRWLPGYGFFVWVIRDRLDQDGNPYPHAQLRDPFDAYPGSWGVDQIPHELAVVRRVPLHHIERRYPWVSSIRLDQMSKYGRWSRGSTMTAQATDDYSPRWDTLAGEGEIVAEYYDDEGAWTILAEHGVILNYRPNVKYGVPQFVVGKRYDFDALISHYAHALGLQAAMAKFIILSVIAMQDATFAETNVFGDKPRGGVYRKGRDATNYFAPGTKVEKNIGQLPYQMFQQINVIERQLRNQAGYPVTDDAESPVGYATGAAVNQLQGSIQSEVVEYQQVIGDALERLDYIRLCWDEVEYGGRYRKRRYNHLYNYDPKSIGGNYRTERKYGVMAGFDEPEKIVTGLQLLQAGILDHRTLAENLDGVDEFDKIDERNQQRRAQDLLFEIMSQQGVSGNEAAIQSFIDLMPAGAAKDALVKFFRPGEGEEPTEAQLGGTGQLPGQLPDQPPDTQTVLSQLGLSGEVEGGAQVVARG